MRAASGIEPCCTWQPDLSWSLRNPRVQLWAFGVVIGLGMAWDQPYTGPQDQLRLLPGQAAEVLRDWAAVCRAWRVGAQGWAQPLRRARWHASWQLLAAALGLSERHSEAGCHCRERHSTWLALPHPVRHVSLPLYCAWHNCA